MTTAAFAVIVGLASPMAGSLSSRLQSKNGLGLLTASVKLAFSSANHLGQEVVICGSSDGVNCSGSDNWNTGWIIYFDDGGRNIIHVSDSPRNIDIIVDGFPNNNQITIQPTRLSVEESATFGTFAACQLPNNRAAAGLIVSNHGYVRAATDSNADGDVENHNDANARCT